MKIHNFIVICGIIILLINTLPISAQSTPIPPCPNNEICIIKLKAHILVRNSWNNPSYIDPKKVTIKDMVVKANQVMDDACIEFKLEEDISNIVIPDSGPGYTVEPPTPSDPNSYLKIIDAYLINSAPDVSGNRIFTKASKISPEYQPISVVFADKISAPFGNIIADSFMMPSEGRLPSGEVVFRFVMEYISFFPNPPNPITAYQNHIPHETGHVAMAKSGNLFNDHTTNPGTLSTLSPLNLMANPHSSSAMTNEQKWFYYNNLCHEKRNINVGAIPPTINPPPPPPPPPPKKGPITQTCGDGIVVGGEQCDPPEQCINNEICSATCTLVLHCGDGIVNCGEECDPDGSVCWTQNLPGVYVVGICNNCICPTPDVQQGLT